MNNIVKVNVEITIDKTELHNAQKVFTELSKYKLTIPRQNAIKSALGVFTATANALHIDTYESECNKSREVLEYANIKAYIEKPATFDDTEIVVYIEEFGCIHKLVMDNDIQVSCPSAIKIGTEDFECRLYLNTDETDTKFYGLQLDLYNLITDESDGNLITNYDFDEFIMCEIKPQIELEYLKQFISDELSKIENYKGEGYVEGDDIDLAVEAIKKVIN